MLSPSRIHLHRLKRKRILEARMRSHGNTSNPNKYHASLTPVSRAKSNTFVLPSPERKKKGGLFNRIKKVFV